LTILPLLHLCDSLFPIGGFGYSDGLEAATAAGLVRSGADLRAWLDVCLDENIGRTDGPTLCGAWSAFSAGDLAALAALDEEYIALRPSMAARRSTRAMGLRLLTTWNGLYPHEGLDRLLALAAREQIAPALPVAFACACASAGVTHAESAAAFAYTRLASAISAAMRLMSIGQSEAHAELACVLNRVPAVVAAMHARTRSEAFAPAMDIAVISQQYLHSRLFRS
jgi:urease accessory protein